MLDSSYDRGNELKVSLLVTLSSLPFLVAVLHHSIHLSFFAIAVLPSHLPFVAIINYGEYTASRLEQTAFSFVSLPCKCQGNVLFSVVSAFDNCFTGLPCNTVEQDHFLLFTDPQVSPPYNLNESQAHFTVVETYY